MSCCLSIRKQRASPSKKCKRSSASRNSITLSASLFRPPWTAENESLSPYAHILLLFVFQNECAISSPRPPVSPTRPPPAPQLRRHSRLSGHNSPRHVRRR